MAAEIPKSDRIQIPPSTKPSPNTLRSVAEGKTLPTPQALLKNHELVDAFILNIERQDTRAKMALLPAIERYLEEIEKMDPGEIRTLTRDKSRERLRLILAAIGGIAATKIFNNDNFLLQLVSALIIYAGLRSTLPDRLAGYKSHGRINPEYAVVKRKLLDAMHPTWPRVSAD